MSNRIRALLAIGSAILCCLALASQAQASRGFRAAGNGPIPFAGPLNANAGAINVNCNGVVNLAFTVNPIPKAVGAPIGLFVNGNFNCGAGVILTFLPNAVLRYRNFHGVLPNITGIGVSSDNFAWRLQTPIGVCLYNATPANPQTGILILRNAAGFVTGIRFLGNPTPVNLARSAPPALCGNFGTLTGVLNGAGPQVVLI